MYEESKSSLLPSGQKTCASGTALISPRRDSTGSTDARTDRSSMKGRLVASQSTDDLREFMSNSTDAGSLRLRTRSQDSRPTDAARQGEEANSLSLAAPLTSLHTSGSMTAARVQRERDRKKAATLMPDRSRRRKESDNDGRSGVDPVSQEKRRELMLQRLEGILDDHVPSIASQPNSAEAQSSAEPAAASGSGSTNADAALPAEASTSQLSPASGDDWQHQVMRTLRSRTISTILSGTSQTLELLQLGTFTHLRGGHPAPTPLRQDHNCERWGSYLRHQQRRCDIYNRLAFVSCSPPPVNLCYALALLVWL
jgi:hypothetical protein